MPDYTANALDHFANPRNAGALEGADLVGTAGTPGQGPHVQMFVKLGGAGDGNSTTIADIRFKTWGCPAAIASCSKLTEMVKGSPVAEALSVTPGNLLEAIGGLPLGKHHCPRLAVAALRDALEDVKTAKGN